MVRVLMMLVLCVFVAAGCSEAQDEPEQPGAGGDGSPGGGEPVQEDTGQGGELTKAGGEVRIEQAVLTTDPVSPEEAQPVSSFRTGLDEVSVVGYVEGAPEDTEVEVFWIAEDIPETEDYEAVRDEELAEDQAEVEGDRPFEFTLETDDPLPPGEYAAELALNGTVVETLDFTVYQPSTPVLFRPESMLPGAPSSAPSNATPTTLQFIVDASGSMNETVESVVKIDAARNALQTLVTALPEDADYLDVGLRAYSHRVASEGEEGCGDTELLVPMNGVSKEDLRSQIDSLKAVGGRTPMAATVEQAAGDFTSDEGENVAVLVNDGKENCSGDPVADIEDAAGQADLTVHVVGFDIGESDARDQLQQIADATGGIYVDAQTPDELTESLQEIAEEELNIVSMQSGAGEAVFEAPRGAELWSWDIFDEEGNELSHEFGPAENLDGVYQLPAGIYVGEIKASSISEPGRFRFEVGAGQETPLRLSGLRLTTRQVPWQIALQDLRTGRVGLEVFTNDSDSEYLGEAVIIPPGPYTVLFKSSAVSDFAAVAEEVEIEPGQVTQLRP